MRVLDLVPWKSSRGNELASRHDHDAVAALQADFNRAFDFLRMLPMPFASAAPPPNGEAGGFHIDVAENDKEITVSAELPGMDGKDIDVRASDGMLTISGVKTTQHEVEDDGYVMRERSFGRFERTIPLPEGADPEAAQATFKSGVLTITIPKDSTQAGAKRIAVQSH